MTRGAEPPRAPVPSPEPRRRRSPRAGRLPVAKTPAGLTEDAHRYVPGRGRSGMSRRARDARRPVLEVPTRARRRDSRPRRRAHSGRPVLHAREEAFVVDCRLALALSEIAVDLRALGVTEARYSGAYVYRTSHPGRMSLHAYGLAIDLHEFKVSGEGLLVKRRSKGVGLLLDPPLLNLWPVGCVSGGCFTSK